MRSFLILVIIFASSAWAGELKPGFAFMVGGRYDNLRMCVASDSGVPGGLIAEGSLVLEWPKESFNVGLKIPILRPTLFGIAFKMFQFEPEAYFFIPLGENEKWSITPGLGAVVHYGPDYLSDLENRSEEFWAFGPLISLTAGFSFSQSNNKTIGLRAFYSPLWGEGDRSGFVVGGALEFRIVKAYQ